MPDGKTHAIASLCLAAGSAGAYITTHTIIPDSIAPATALAWGLGSLAGIVLTPDLDLNTGSISQRTMRRAGCLIGAAWAALWWPYAHLIGHRSWLSHMPIVGTLLRLAYLFGLPMLVQLGLNHFGLLPPPNARPILGFLSHQGLNLVIGLALSDLVHFIMDAA